MRQRVLRVLVACLLFPMLGAVALASPASAKVACADVMFFGVRGSGEAPQGDRIPGSSPTNPDNMGKPIKAAYVEFKRQMDTKRVSVDPEAVLYAAIGVWPPYRSNYLKLRSSVNGGVKKLGDRFRAQVVSCPFQQFIMAGYSQGAWVVQDFLTSISGTSLGRKIMAVLLYGSPRFHPNDAFVYGRPRDPNGSGGIVSKTLLPAWVAHARTYCNTGDPVCKYSLGSVITCVRQGSRCPHGKYVQYQSAVASWLAGLFNRRLKKQKVSA